MVGSLPVVQQIVQLRIEVVGGRVPGLHEKIIDIGLIDGADGGVRVGVGSEQGPLGFRINVLRFLQEGDAVHARHALIGQKQCHAVAADLELLEQVERALGRIASNDAIFSAVMRAKIALNRPQHVRVVIDTQ